jgi:hypothetical protein
LKKEKKVSEYPFVASNATPLYQKTKNSSKHFFLSNFKEFLRMIKKK